jgi:hypothetical protein
MAQAIVAFTDSMSLKLVLYRVGYKLDTSIRMKYQSRAWSSPPDHPFQQWQYIVNCTALAQGPTE